MTTTRRCRRSSEDEHVSARPRKMMNTWRRDLGGCLPRGGVVGDNGQKRTDDVPRRRQWHSRRTTVGRVDEQQTMTAWQLRLGRGGTRDGVVVDGRRTKQRASCAVDKKRMTRRERRELSNSYIYTSKNTCRRDTTRTKKHKQNLLALQT